jgi:hypothetical protein
MNDFCTGFFRLRTENRLFPLQSEDVCQSGKHLILETVAVRKIPASRERISFAKGLQEVKLSDVMRSQSTDEFATEMVKGFSLRGKN